MKLAQLTCAAIFGFSFAALAYAQGDPGQLRAVGEEPPPQLGQVWYETEGDWQGTWTPLHPAARDGAYAARWALGRTIEHATLQFRMPTSLAVEIVRTQPRGTCNYRGFLNAAGTVVNGTYTCAWARTPMPWRASIGAVVPRTQAGDVPRVAAIFEYLQADWSETEGDWRGRWTQINPGTGDGWYNARWTKGNDHATATLQMSVDPAAGRITVHRRDPDGRQCTYTGVINNATLRSVTGTYRCTGQEDSLPWHAAVLLPGR